MCALLLDPRPFSVWLITAIISDSTVFERGAAKPLNLCLKLQKPRDDRSEPTLTVA